MIDFIIHLDQNLAWALQQYGTWVYVIVFIVIFCETGLVVTPFLPGDSLLFILGTMAAAELMSLKLILAVIIVAGIIGDSVNYHVGRSVGPRLFRSETNRLLNKKHLESAQKFYAKHGAKTLIIARFMPIIRTFAPFVAGMGNMEYPKFLAWNIIGAVVWAVSITLAGYVFGNIPFIKDNLTIVILLLIVIPALPTIIAYLQEKYKKQ